MEPRQQVVNYLREHPSSSTHAVACACRLYEPGPMGHDGRERALKILRELEHEGMVSMEPSGAGNYYWTLLSEMTVDPAGMMI